MKLKTAQETLDKNTSSEGFRKIGLEVYNNTILKAMKEYAEQFIDLAAESLERLNTGGNPEQEVYITDKKSILKLKEQIK